MSHTIEQLQKHAPRGAIIVRAERDIVVCCLPDNRVTPFVTWKYSEPEGCQLSFYWGHYLTSAAEAARSFVGRADLLEWKVVPIASDLSQALQDAILAKSPAGWMSKLQRVNSEKAKVPHVPDTPSNCGIATGWISNKTLCPFCDSNNVQPKVEPIKDYRHQRQSYHCLNSECGCLSFDVGDVHGFAGTSTKAYKGLDPRRPGLAASETYAGCGGSRPCSVR